MGQNIQEWTNYNLWNTAFKILEVMWFVKTDRVTPNFLKTLFLKFYLVRS